jgi:hypothetical protein
MLDRKVGETVFSLDDWCTRLLTHCLSDPVLICPSTVGPNVRRHESLHSFLITWCAKSSLLGSNCPEPLVLHPPPPSYFGGICCYTYLSHQGPYFVLRWLKEFSSTISSLLWHSVTKTGFKMMSISDFHWLRRQNWRPFMWRLHNDTKYI